MPDLETVSLSKREAMTNNAKIGDTLGFLTENVKSQKDLVYRFPHGILNIRSLILDLASKKVIAPYGNYNANYLAINKTLLYSDDLELSYLSSRVLNKLYFEKNINPKSFINSLANAMKDHWLEMKKSGDYGVDGLYHGKRGYSNNTLLVLSSLSAKKIEQSQWSNKWPNRSGNDAIVRSWVIGSNIYLKSEEDAFELGKIQSHITNSDPDMAIASGVISSLFYKITHTENMSKKEITQYLIDNLKKRNNESSFVLKAVELGVNLARRQLNPIMVYSSITGFTYNDLISLMVYSFLYFDNFENALTNIVHTTGDNDSLGYILGALFGAYDGKSLSPVYLEYLEAKDINLIN